MGGWTPCSLCSSTVHLIYIVFLPVAIQDVSLAPSGGGGGGRGRGRKGPFAGKGVTAGGQGQGAGTAGEAAGGAGLLGQGVGVGGILWPPCGALLPSGTALLAAPLCFMFEEPVAIYHLHRSLYCRCVGFLI